MRDMRGKRTKQPATPKLHKRKTPRKSESSAESERWPIVRAYVPVRDIWAATGCGSAGFIRQQPDGRYAMAFFTLALINHGLEGMWGKGDMSLAEIDNALARLRDDVPPMEEGPAELAAAYVRGGHALAESQGITFPPRKMKQLFNLVPGLPGSPNDWKKRLVGPRGLSPADLLRVIRANPQPADMPKGKETLILTEASFRVQDTERAKAVLQRAHPEFSLDWTGGSTSMFDWTRENSRTRSSPLRLFGERQLLGSVRVEPGELVAEAMTLSMTARLMNVLRKLFGAEIQFKSAQWTDYLALALALSR